MHSMPTRVLAQGLWINLGGLAFGTCSVYSSNFNSLLTRINTQQHSVKIESRVPLSVKNCINFCPIASECLDHYCVCLNRISIARFQSGLAYSHRALADQSSKSNQMGPVRNIISHSILRSTGFFCFSNESGFIFRGFEGNKEQSSPGSLWSGLSKCFQSHSSGDKSLYRLENYVRRQGVHINYNFNLFFWLLFFFLFFL